MMTKKETLEMESLRQQLAEAQALRFTEPVLPDLKPPSPGSGRQIVNGWSYLIYNDQMEVAKACTSSIYHSFREWDKTSSQNPKSLYSTELLATKAARSELAVKFSKALARADRRIAELSKVDPGTVE